MSAAAPWSVKGIDPKAREVAKDLARRSGMTLGEWLNRVILEDDLPDEVANQADFAQRPRLRIAPAPAVATPPDLARVAFALDRLTDRIEASETRTGLAINGVEHSVRQALARIETAEREQLAVTARLDGALSDTTSEQSRLIERMRRMEAEAVGPRSIEALRAMESRLSRAEPEAVVERVLQRLGDRLATAESRTAAALDDLGRSLGALDARVGAAERGGSDELKFEALAEVLTHRVEAARAEIAEKLQATAGGAVEARLAEMAEHIRIAEQRSARAVEDLGRQVLTMAEAVGRKLTDVDQRSADAIDQVGTEVARIAGAVEQRLARGEHAQAEAFERLGAELSRVTETLAQRLSISETRATEALDGVGEQVARVTERVAQRFAPLSDPIEPEPVTDPLDEIYQRLGPPPEPEPEAAFAPPPEPPAATFGAELLSRAEPGPLAEDPDTGWRRARFDPEPAVETVDAAWRRLDLEVPETEIPESFAPLPEDDDDLFESAPRVAENPQLSTREVIDRARAAARAQQGAKPAEVRAKVDPRAATGRLFQGFGRPARQRPSTAMQTALMVAGGAAFLSVGAAGLTLMQGPGSAPQEQAEVSPFGPNPRAAVALAPASLNPAAAANGFENNAIQAPVASPVFAQVRADVEAGAPGAVASLKALADAGHAQAQLYLAELYHNGDAGLPRNPVESRRLLGLAADGGDVQAMHNLGIALFRGEGGGQDVRGAAQWFRKAADAGLVDSQYNLARLYQSGNGVPKDLAQARHWFEAAAARGDTEARRALAGLQPRPKAQLQSQAVRPAPARAPVAHAPDRTASAGSPNVRQAQDILTRLGYYEGPADGHATEAYRVALFKYQRDQRDQTAGPRPYAPQN